MKQPKTKAPAAHNNKTGMAAGVAIRDVPIDPDLPTLDAFVDAHNGNVSVEKYAERLQVDLNDLGIQLANARMIYVGAERRILAAMEIKSQQIIAVRASTAPSRSVESPAVPS